MKSVVRFVVLVSAVTLPLCAAEAGAVPTFETLGLYSNYAGEILNRSAQAISRRVPTLGSSTGFPAAASQLSHRPQGPS